MGRSAVPRYFFTIRGRDRGVPNQCNGVRRAADETTTRAGALAGTDGGDGDELLSARFGAAATLLRCRLLRLTLAARTSHDRRTLGSGSVGIVASKGGR